MAPSVFSRRKRSQQPLPHHATHPSQHLQPPSEAASNALLAAGLAFAASSNAHNPNPQLSSSAAAAALKSASQQPPNPTTVIGRIPTKRMLERRESYSSSVGSLRSNGEGARARGVMGPTISRSASSASSMSTRKFRGNEGSRSRLAMIAGDRGSSYEVRQGGSSSPAGSWDKGKQKSSEGSLDIGAGDFTFDHHVPAVPKIPHEIYEREVRKERYNSQAQHNHHHDHMHHHRNHQYHQHHSNSRSNHHQREMNRQDPQLQSSAAQNQNPQRRPSQLNKSTCNTCDCSCHDSPPPSLIYQDEEEEEEYDNLSIESRPPFNEQLQASQPIETKQSRHRSYDYPHNDYLVDEEVIISPRSTAPPPLGRPSSGVRRYSAPPTTSNPTVASPTSPTAQSQNFFRLLRTDVNSSAPPAVSNSSASATKRFPSMKFTKSERDNEKDASATNYEQLPTPSASPPDSFRSGRMRKGMSMHRDELLHGRMIVTPAAELSPPQSVSPPGSTRRQRRKVSDNSTATNSTLSNNHISDIIGREETISPSPSGGGRRRRRRRGGRGGGATEPPPVPPIPTMMNNSLRNTQPNAIFKSSNGRVAQEGDLLAKGTLREEADTRRTKGRERAFVSASIMEEGGEALALKAARDAAGRGMDDKTPSLTEKQGAIGSEERKRYGIKRQGRKMCVELENEDVMSSGKPAVAGLRNLDDDDDDDDDDNNNDGINEMIESRIVTDSSDLDDDGIRKEQAYSRRKYEDRRDDRKSIVVQEADIPHTLQLTSIPEEHEKKKGKEKEVIKAQHKRINSVRQKVASGETNKSSSDELEEPADSILLKKTKKISRTLSPYDTETLPKPDPDMSQTPGLPKLEERPQQSLPTLILQPSTPQSLQEPFPEQTKRDVDNNRPTSPTPSNANSDSNPLEKKHLLRVLSNPEIPTVMHDPPPRSVSPGKSAMKKTPSLKQGTRRREGKGQVVQFSDTASEIEIDYDSPPSPWGVVNGGVEQGEKKEKEKKAGGFSSWFRRDKGKEKDKEKKGGKKGKLSRKKGGEVSVLETAVQGRDALPPSSASSQNGDVDEVLKDDSITLKKLSPVPEVKEEAELGQDVFSPSSPSFSSASKGTNAVNGDPITSKMLNPAPEVKNGAEIESESITTTIPGHIPGEWPTTQQALSSTAASTSNNGGYFAGVEIPLTTAAAALRPPSTCDIEDNSDKGSISGISVYEDAPEELPFTSPPNSPPPTASPPAPHASPNRTEPRLDKIKETQISSPKSPSQQLSFPKSLRSSTPVSSSTTIASQSTKRRECSRSPSPPPSLPAAKYALPAAAITARTQALIDERRRQIELGKGGSRKKPAIPSNKGTESESETEVEMENYSYQQRANGKKRGTSGVSPAVRAAMLSGTTSKATVIVAKGNGHAHLHKAKKNTSTEDQVQNSQQQQSSRMMSRASFRSSEPSQPATPTSPSKPSTFLGFRTGSLTMTKDKEKVKDKDKHLRLRNLPAKQPNRFTSRFSHDSSDDDTGDHAHLGWGAFQSHISAAESSSSSDDDGEVEAAKEEREREVERLVALISKNKKLESEGKLVRPTQANSPPGTGNSEGTVTSNDKVMQGGHDNQEEDESEEEIVTLSGTVGGEKDKKKDKKKKEKQKKQKGKERKGWGGIFGSGSADKKIDHVPLPKMRAADVSDGEKAGKGKREGAGVGAGDAGGVLTSTSTTKAEEKGSSNASTSTNGNGSKLKRMFGIGR